MLFKRENDGKQEIYSSFKNDQISHFAHLFGGAMGAFWGFYRS
jgi:hypothetical protein